MENLDKSTLKAQHLLDSVRGVFPNVLKQLELASGQLSTDQDFHFYANFKEFKNPVKDIQNRAVSLLSQISALKDFRSCSSPWPADSEEAYDWLVGVQDDLLERVDALLDKSRFERKEAKQKQPELAAFQASASEAMTSPRDVKVARKGKDGSNRLPVPFHVRGIPRPQDKFDLAPDNSNSRFRHPCPLARKLENDTVSSGANFAVDANKNEADGFVGSTHPLEAELKELAFMEPILEPIEARKPGSLQDTPFTFVDTLHSLKGMADKLRTAAEIALDLEHHHYRSYQGFVCLMQVSTRLEDFVVDTLSLRSHIGPCLADIISDSKVLKVIHGADRDIVWLQRDFGIYVCNMFDTGQAARVLELPSAGLAFLLEQFCGVIADKRYQMADWRIRPLPAEMLKYAREDTHYLLYIHDLLKQQLLALRSSPDFDGEDPLVQVYRRSRDICLQLYTKEPFTDTSFLHLHGLYDKQFRPDQLAAVAKLYAWRDQMARKDDESTGYVLPNHLLFQLATEMPENVRRLQMIAKGPHSYVGRNAGVLVALIREAKENPLLTPVPPPSKPRDSKLQQEVVDKAEASSVLEVGAPEIFTSEDGDEMETLEVLAVKQQVEEVSVRKGHAPSQLVPTPGCAVVSRKAGSVFFSSRSSKSMAVETAVSTARLERDVLVAVPSAGASGRVGGEPTSAASETLPDGEGSLANHSASPPVGFSWNPTDKRTVDVREIAGSRTKSESVVSATLASSTDSPAQRVIPSEEVGDCKEGSSFHEVETGSLLETQPHARGVPEVKLKRKIKGLGASLFRQSRQQGEGVCQRVTLPDQVQAKLKAQAVESSIALPFKTTTLVHQAVCSDSKADNPEEMEAPENVDPAVNASQLEGSAERQDQNAVLADVLMFDCGNWTNNDVGENTTDQERRREPWPPSGEESSSAGASGGSVDLKGIKPKGVEASETDQDQQNSSFPPSLSEIHQTHRRRKRNRGVVPVLPSNGPTGVTGAHSSEGTGQRKKSKLDHQNASKVVDLDACEVSGSFSYAEARKRLGVDNLYAAKVDEQRKSVRKGKFNKKPITSNKSQNLGFDALRRFRVDPKPEGIPKAPRRQVFSMTGNRSATFKK